MPRLYAVAERLLDGSMSPADWVDHLNTGEATQPSVAVATDAIAVAHAADDRADPAAETVAVADELAEAGLAGATGAAATADPFPAAPKPPREGSKMAALIALLQRPEGADLDQMVEATGWLKHTARAVLSRDLGKRFGLKPTSTKEDGRRVYRLLPNEVEAA